MKAQNENKYVMVNKRDENSILSFSDHVELSLKNANFPNDLSTAHYITYALLAQIIAWAKKRHLGQNVKFNRYKHKKESMNYDGNREFDRIHG